MNRFYIMSVAASLEKSIFAEAQTNQQLHTSSTYAVNRAQRIVDIAFYWSL